ncbi:hypothetical protein TNCV_220591 [Trichonephila clavipes]|nr:hypothetical protein TNCV_220591 [Trichonephila clavipes]
MKKSNIAKFQLFIGTKEYPPVTLFLKTTPCFLPLNHPLMDHGQCHREELKMKKEWEPVQCPLLLYALLVTEDESLQLFLLRISILCEESKLDGWKVPI